ncbi:MAG: hypothetical protein IE910_12155 [Brevundimonas sp.]|nr:hypothetical protein [Brevundimonas sp.]
MRTPRRARPNEHDLSRLKAARDILESLMIQLRPATPEHRSLVNAFDAVRTVAIDWTGNPEIWSGADSAGRRGLPDAFLKRPQHPKWPR